MGKVKVFGLQRSGVNYLEWILANNLGLSIELSLGWRHGLPYERYRNAYTFEDMDCTIEESLVRHNISPIVIYKDKDHWLASIERDPKNFYVKRSDPEEFYDVFLEAWRGKAPMVRYESILADFKGNVDRLAQMFRAEVRHYEEPEKVPSSENWLPEHRGRYL